MIEPVTDDTQASLFGDADTPYVPARPDKVPPARRERVTQPELLADVFGSIIAHDGTPL